MMSWLHRLAWLSVRPSWVDELDFVGPRVRTAVWSWLILAAGVVAMMMVVDVMDHLEQDLVDARQQFRRLSQADRQLRLNRAIEQGQSSARAESGAGPVSSPPPLRGAGLVDGLSMARLLAYPWAATLNRIEAEASTHQVVLMSMSVDLDKQRQSTDGAPIWRLQAAVRDDPSALAWAARLPGGRLLSRDRLAQPFSAEAGSYTLKVDAQMADGGGSP